MVTYLPTILMNLINQATTYMEGASKYSLIITVNMYSSPVSVFGSNPSFVSEPA